MTLKKIDPNQFSLLKVGRPLVHRINGKVQSYSVGRNYIIMNSETKEQMEVRCTQNCPHALIAIEELKKYGYAAKRV